MELTFEQQVIVAVIGGVVASILTSILNNWWTDRRLRDQWEREKEERLEQWRREQEARRREWKREYRKELLRPFLGRVSSLVAIAGMLVAESKVWSAAQAAGREPDSEMPTPLDRKRQLAKEVFAIESIAIQDSTFSQLQTEFRATAENVMLEEDADEVVANYVELEVIAKKLHGRAEELLEETFD